MHATKTLVVIRHGHAVEGQEDYERTLSPRGIDEVRATGGRLAAQVTRVGHILTSSAPRAAATAQEIAPFCQFTGTIEQDRSLYLAHPRALFSALARTDDSIRTLVLVGHNPGLSTFVELLTGSRTELGTAEVRKISLEVNSWSLIAAGLGREVGED